MMRNSSVVGFIGVAALYGAFPCGVSAQDFFEDLDRRLTFATADGAVVTDVSMITDVVVFAQDAPAQGLLISDNDLVVAPRLAVFFDTGIGERVRAHVQLDFDTGSDPHAESQGDVRLDEYFVEGRVTEVGRLTVRAGKFATAFGGWVARHLASDNPMITAPLLYEDVLPITDRALPRDRAAFAQRRDVVDKQPAWLPIVWAAAYTSGVSLRAGSDTFDATVEVKNASISSRPKVWDVLPDGSETDPSVTAHVRWQPAQEWSLGSSFSRGAYLQDDVTPPLPVDRRIDDFDQTTWGLDAAYAHRSVQIWSELARVEFAVPGIGDVHGLSGYVESRYKISPQVWLGARWNQSWFDDVPGLDMTWNRDMRRLDLALGYRHSAHLQVKAQYSRSDQAGRSIDGEHLFAAQCVVWF